MKILLSLLFVLIVLKSVNAQEKSFERKGRFEGRKPPGHEMRHLRFVKNILSEKCIKKAQITPEQVDKLKKKFNQLDKEMFKLNKKIRELSKNQAEIATEILTTPGSNPEEIFKLTEDIGKLRIEQAKHSVKVILIVRDNLTSEQCATVVKIMREERNKMSKRMKMMREKRKNHRGSRPNRFDDELQNKPLEEGDAETSLPSPPDEIL